MRAGTLKSLAARATGPSVWPILDQVLVSGGNFVATMLVARHCGIEEFGVYSLAWLTMLLTNSVQLSLIISPMMSIWPKQLPGSAGRYFTTVHLQQILFAGVMFVLLWGGVWTAGAAWGAERVSALAFPIAVAATAFQLQDYGRRYLFCRGLPRAACLNDALAYGGRIGLLALLLPGGGADSADVMWMFAVAHGAAIPFALLRGLRVAYDRRYALAVTRRHWRSAKWLAGSGVLLWLSSSLFPLVAGSVGGPAAVGALQAGATLVRIANILFLGLENLVPVVAARRLHERGSGAMLSYLGQVSLGGGALTVALAVVAAAAPEFWLGLMFGDSFRPYGFVLHYYAVVNVVMFFLLPLQAGLRALERTRAVFAAYLAGTAASAAIAYPAALALGLPGILLALLLNYLLIGAVMAVGLMRAVQGDRPRAPLPARRSPA